jgi:hypothetical protein
MRLRWIIGLVVVTILFSVYNGYLVDESWFMEGLTRPERHVIKFASVLIVYAMGILAFSGRSPAWLIHLWHILYGTLLLLLVLLSLFDAYVSTFPPAFRGLGVSLHVFLISPIPYVFVSIIGRSADGMMRGPQ